MPLILCKVSRAVYLRHNDRLAIMLHSMLSAEVCKKALRIRNSRGNGTLFVQLLQSDIESIVTGFLSFLDVGAAIAQIIAPAHLLWKAVGPIASLVVISPIGEFMFLSQFSSLGRINCACQFLLLHISFSIGKPRLLPQSGTRKV